MTAREAPRLATILLERLGPDPETLVGDLAEEYIAGRSAAWYWRQVLGSIVIGAGRDLWTHKWLVVQAQATFVGLHLTPAEFDAAFRQYAERRFRPVVR